MALTFGSLCLPGWLNPTWSFAWNLRGAARPECHKALAFMPRDIRVRFFFHLKFLMPKFVERYATIKILCRKRQMQPIQTTSGLLWHPKRAIWGPKRPLWSLPDPHPAPRPPQARCHTRQSGQSGGNSSKVEGPPCVPTPTKAPGPLIQI